jgi:hypothetical protein
MPTMTFGNEKNNETSDTADHFLRNRVEQSVALLCDRENPSAIQSPAVSSARSSLPIHIDAAYMQKGALVDAAKALAALWKVPSRAKLPTRAMQYSR